MYIYLVLCICIICMHACILQIVLEAGVVTNRCDELYSRNPGGRELRTAASGLSGFGDLGFRVFRV